MKIWLFVMFLTTPGGMQPPHVEPMDTLDACIAKVAEAHKSFIEQNENFRFSTICVQHSVKNTES